MKICMIGDSQLGALKLALDGGLVDTGSHQISFFAAVAGKAHAFRFTTAAILPGALDDIRHSTQGVFDQIKAGDFEALVFYGTGLEFGQWVRPNENALTPNAYSSAFLTASVTAKIARSPCLKLAEAVSRAPGWPRTIIICPAPARRRPDNGVSEAEPLFSGAALNTCAASLCALIEATFVPQPAETLTADFYTRPEFSTGSQRFIPDHPAHPVTERNHMNAAYGALMLRDILAALH